MSITSTVTLAVIALALIAFRSRLTLCYAIAHYRWAIGKLPADYLRIEPGQTHHLNNYVDSLDGWAGSVSIRRNADGSYCAISEAGRYRSGPSDDDTVYVNGRKVGRNMTVPIPAGATVIRRVPYGTPLIRVLNLA